MKDTLKPGLTFEFQFKVPENKTVPHLYPEMPEGQVMPKVFATGYLVGLFEFSCIKFMNPHLDWPEEQSVGIGININHSAATPPGFTITVRGKLEKVEGKKLSFSLSADDGVDKISEGTHERFVINAEKFNAGVEAKLKKGLSHA
ncbi:MAG: thioesterase [Desulfobacteraceae bacterium IS3]|nr:MAG: thioesterase [Desulfobacteraceae bacterium IS3]